MDGMNCRVHSMRIHQSPRTTTNTYMDIGCNTAKRTKKVMRPARPRCDHVIQIDRFQSYLMSAINLVKCQAQTITVENAYQKRNIARS
ncbi:hypothetical protein KIN20_000846 [Parelaphostrongylus tenuis]|uniref:Uncharacterized protein n=1 Tax=Parelaphostrongylus tenuis TaxID=148309 RepID=A0AAD5ML98_PARTN|nr:hypothetical protein KIN20_000846 [Parelaphostrongylus tenuis]